MEVFLRSPARITPYTGDLAFCDAWDAPDQTTDPRSPSQTLDLAVAPTLTATVDGVTRQLPADVWRVEYVHSEASLAGSLPSTGARERCAEDQPWTTDPVSIGVETTNTARFVLDRDALRAALGTEFGVTDVGDYLPLLAGKLGFTATTAESGELPDEGSIVQVYDAYAIDWGDGPA